MGIEHSSHYRGHRSRHGLIFGENNNNYKDSRYAKKAKNELYELFLQDKITHVHIVQEELNKIAQLQADNESMAKDIERLKAREVQLVAGITATQRLS